MNGITNIYIEKVMCNFNLNFKGVFSSNDIPFFTENENISFICNLSKRNQKGSHYVAMFIFNHKIIYFDPLGFDCYVKEIIDYLKLYKRKVEHSYYEIQHPFYFHCGYFCIGFILALSSKLSLTQYSNLFEKINLTINDDIVCNFIIEMINKYLHLYFLSLNVDHFLVK